MRVFLLVIVILTLTACNPQSNDPLIQVATSVAPDAGFIPYRHQSGVFSIRIPSGWIYNELPDDNGVRVEFSTLEENESVVRLMVYIVNTGAPMSRETFLQVANAYLPPVDVADYEWQQLEAPVDQPDGSRRVVGVRHYPTIGSRALNIFMQPNGSYFSVLEADVTEASETTLRTLHTVINTFRVNPDARIEEGEIVGGITYTGNVGFEGYLAWEDRDGGFNITGYVVNHQDYPVEAMRLTGYLFDARGNRLSEEARILSQEVLRPGESAPFRLRFEGGKPTTAVRYEIHAAARPAEFSLQNFYGLENFTVVEQPAQINENGNLVLTGQLANSGSRLVKSVRIIVSVLNTQGQVVGTETQFINKDQLLPGEVDSYEVVVYDIGGEMFRYVLTVVGMAE